MYCNTNQMIHVFVFTIFRSLTNTFDSVSHWATSRTPEVCNWTFTGNQLQNDEILLITFKSHEKHFRDYDWILLPNGDLHSWTNETILITNTDRKPWCGLFVKKQQNGETTCQFDFNIPNNLCRNQPVTTVSVDWPPKMYTSMEYYSYVKIEYAFLSCPKSKTSPSTIITTTTTVLPTNSLPMTVPVNSTDKRAKNLTTKIPLSKSINDSSKLEKDASFIAAITLGALLAVSGCVIGVLLRKERKKKENPVSKTPANDRNVESNAENANHQMTSGPEIVNNEIYDFTAADQTKQTVYNELYNVT